MSNGRVALVTGANTGIGYELVRLLSEKGFKVYLGARTESKGRQAVEALKADGVQNVYSLYLDVTKPASITAARDILDKADGKIDVLVNNAGIGRWEANQNATNCDVDAVRDTFETNFIGLIQNTITMLPLVRKAPKGTGVIVNLSSDMASNTLQARRDAGMHLVGYNPSKAAVNSYTIALAHELRAEGIKVNCVTPGYTSTQLNLHGKGGKSPRAGAEIILPWALLDRDGPTGLFINEFGTESPW